jgi:hypothetical protein
MRREAFSIRSLPQFAFVAASEGRHAVLGRLAVALALVFFVAVEASIAAEIPTLLQWRAGDNDEAGPPGPDKPLETDRPDFTEASTTVGRGVFQLESGYTFYDDRTATGSTHSHSLPEFNCRIGMFAEWFELRLGWNYFTSTDTQFGVSRSTFGGAEDMSIGAKWGITGQSGILPEIAVITATTVPTGASSQTAGEMLPIVEWINAWDITENISLAAQSNFGRALDSVTGDPYLELVQTFNINYQFVDKLGGYTEWFVIATDGADTNHTQQYFDGGLRYLVNNNVQFDIRAGVGLNEAASDLFTGVGFSFRR